jgi:hypothetical protein
MSIDKMFSCQLHRGSFRLIDSTNGFGKNLKKLRGPFSINMGKSINRLISQITLASDSQDIITYLQIFHWDGGSAHDMNQSFP